MIYGENQVRQAYLVTAVKENLAGLTEAGHAMPVKAFNKWFAHVVETDGVGGISRMTTDHILRGKIRDIRISKPQGLKKQQWVIDIPSTVVVGAAYQMKFLIKDFLGFGEMDRCIKDIVWVARTTSQDDLGNGLVKQIERMQQTAAFKMFASATYTGGKITLVENIINATKKNLELGRMPRNLDMKITTSGKPVAPVAGNPNVTYEATPWAYDKDEEVHYGGSATIVRTELEGIKNAFRVYDMLKFFNKGRGDEYGLMGFPNANPSELPDVDMTKDYICLDIHYFFQNQGIDNEANEKELTFFAPEEGGLAVLEALISGIADVANKDTQTDTTSGRTTYVYPVKWSDAKGTDNVDATNSTNTESQGEE